MLLNVGPLPDGTIQPVHRERLAEMGEWMRKNGESIYGTRGGPIPPRNWGVTTHKGSRVYLHALEPEDGLVATPELRQGDRLGEAARRRGNGPLSRSRIGVGWCSCRRRFRIPPIRLSCSRPGRPMPACARLALCGIAWRSRCGFLLLLTALVGCGGADEPAVEVTYVTDAACEECHVEAFAKWKGSNHFAAMQPASEATVVGDFDDAELTHFGVTTRFSRRGETFLVTTEGPDGAATEYEIAYTFGVEPLQQYLIEFPGGRLQSLTIAWDVGGQRWFSLYPDEKIAADDPLHWTGLYQRWNHMCADCHSTDLRRGYERASDSYQTEWSEITVGCQACHGPGERHLRWARERESGGGDDYGDGDDSLGLVVGSSLARECAAVRSRPARRAIRGGMR